MSNQLASVGSESGIPGVSNGGPPPGPPLEPPPVDVAILIKLDRGFVMRIEAEQEVVTGGTGRTIPRTVMIRMLLKEALDVRAKARGDQVPWSLNVGRPDEVDDEAA